MQKRKTRIQKLISLSAMAALVAPLASGCGSGSTSTTASSASAAVSSEVAEESTAAATEGTASGEAGTTAASQSDDLPTITVLIKGSNGIEGYENNHVTDVMANAIGAHVDIVAADSDKFNVMLASGDGFDIISTQVSNFKQLIEGNVVQPLDDLYAQYGADIAKNIPDAVEFSKAEWSNGTGKLYFLPVQVGLDSVGADTSQGPVTRWDYYAELGYPETSNLDEWLQMLADMQKAHPTTDDGLPVYGVSMFTDWGIWNYKYPMACYLNLNEISGTNLDLYSPSTMEYHNMLEKDGLYWQSIDYYHKANKLGILDPDAFITNYDSFSSKATNGQLLTGPTTWAMGSFNSNHTTDPVGFEVIPTSWAQQWGGTNYKLGWTDKCLGINSKTQYPEVCMKYINYVTSLDGARELYSGVEGTDWTMEDGVPTLTQENIDLFLGGTTQTAFLEAGFGWNANIIGLGTYYVNPDDGKTIDLFRDPSMYPSTLTAVQKDYSEHYGVDYPDEAMQAAREKYGTVDQSNTDSYTVALMSAAPDDITRIEASLTEEAISRASDLVLASDDDYETLKQEAMSSFEDIGLQDVIDYYQDAWNTAKTEAAKYNK